MPAMTWFMHWLLPLLWRLMQGGPLTGAVWPFVVVHDSMTDTLKAVHDSGASTFVPCIGKEEVTAKTAPEPSTPKASGIAGAAKTSEGKASSPSAHSGSAAAAGRGAVALRSPHQSLRQSTSIWMTWTSRLARKRFRSSKVLRVLVLSSGSFHLSVIVKTSGRAKVVGTFTLTDRHGNPYYAFKSDAVIDTLQALIEVPPLAALTDFAKSLSEVTMRDIPNGADVGKVSFSKKTGPPLTQMSVY